MLDAGALAARVVAGERRALAKAITLVESRRGDDQALAEALLDVLLPHTGRAVRLGVSGVPGVGKSTFVEALGLDIIACGKAVAVLAIDPTSSVSGGSLLGDKTRMVELGASPRAFIRPTPAGAALGGVAAHTREALLLCEAAGFDVVIVETVGVGQSEHAVASMVDFFLVLMLAGAGDELQGLKRGLLELADALVINKADGGNVEAARGAASEYRAALGLMRPRADGWQVPVSTASAKERLGIVETWRLVEGRVEAERASGALERRRAHQRRDWLGAALRDGLLARFLERSAVAARLAELETAVEAGAVVPSRAARELLALL